MTISAFLGITHSITGRLWQARSYNQRMAELLTQRTALPDIMARAMAARGIDADMATHYLTPRLRDSLPNPSVVQDMDRAADRMATAIINKDPVAVFGDYDVDGATSSALLLRFGHMTGQNFTLYVPDRMKEGYGPNSLAMKNLATQNIRLTICVDCGTTAYAPLHDARDAGMDVIVLDHHAAEANLPPAHAIVNPNRIDDTSGLGYLAAVGVTYLFIVAVNRTLRQRGFYNTDRPEPDLLSLLDLVALGTVCDVVKLIGLNRAFVAQGLKVMANRHNIGIHALLSIAVPNSPVKADTYTAGFILGPRINAGGRVGKSDLGARLLSTHDPQTAHQLALQLHNLNDERRTIEAAMIADAENLSPPPDMPMAFVAAEHWHPGVIGIVASRLKDKFQHPAIVIALEGDIGKGSCRSVTGIDIGALIIAARQAGIVTQGGGHAMAAGFSVPRDRLNDLRTFLSSRIQESLTKAPLTPTLMIDGLIAGTAVTADFVRSLDQLSPFGTGNPEPRMALADCTIIRADIVGEKHVSLLFTHGGQRHRAIAFRAMDSALGPTLLDRRTRHIHLAGHLRLDTWQGEDRVQIHISDAALAT